MATMGIRPGATQALRGGPVRHMKVLTRAGVNGSANALNGMKIRIKNNRR